MFNLPPVSTGLFCRVPNNFVKSLITWYDVLWSAQFASSAFLINGSNLFRNILERNTPKIALWDISDKRIWKKLCESFIALFSAFYVRVEWTKLNLLTCKSQSVSTFTFNTQRRIQKAVKPVRCFFSKNS